MKVLFVTGVYYPEINGANLQARLLARKLSCLTALKCYVLTGYGSPNLPVVSRIDRTIVVRNHTAGLSLLDRITRLLRFLQLGLILARKVNIVHFHGFSFRNGILQILLKFLRKKTILKMTLFGIDDPLSTKRASLIRWILFKKFDRYVGLTPAFTRSYLESGLDFEKYHLIPNGVDMQRFKPTRLGEKKRIRSRLALPLTDLIVLHIGHFSRIKKPLFVYEVWAETRRRGLHSTLVLIGANSNSPQVDNSILPNIIDNAERDGFFSELVVRSHTDNIEMYLQASDLYISASSNEGLSNALLEALAVGLPSFSTSLPENTSWIQEQLGLLTTINSQSAKEWAREILQSDNKFFFRTQGNKLQFCQFRKDFNINKTAQKIYQVYCEINAQRRLQ